MNRMIEYLQEEHKGYLKEWDDATSKEDKQYWHGMCTAYSIIIGELLDYFDDESENEEDN